MRIGDQNTARNVFIVAEIGNNHEGDFGRAQELVRQAAASGVDAVKFQTFRTEGFVSPVDPARTARLKSFELTFDQFAELAQLTRSLGKKFISTPLDLESARFLTGICDALKIASGDNDYWQLIRLCAETELPLILSSGMTALNELCDVVTFVRDARPDRPFAVLHCTSSYPAPAAQANLRAIPVLATALACEIGYSDHTLGIDACTTAVALGARIIEKHFTLDKNLSAFRDHQLSADAVEMRELVARIRAVEELLGRPVKELQPAEREIVPVARRSAAAARALPRGHVLAAGDIVFLRPGTGFRAAEASSLAGRMLARNVSLGALFALDDLA